MRHPRFFVFVLFLVAIFLFFLDLPQVKLLNFEPLKLKKDLSYRLGLDLQGGTRLVYELDMKDIPENERKQAFEGARSVIDRRVNFFGVRETTIQALKLPGDYRIIIELPGATDIDQILSSLGSTAELSFWEEGKEKIATADAALLPIGMSTVYQNKPVKTKLTGKNLKSVRVVYGSSDGTPQVKLAFTGEGAKLFADITERNVGKIVAIVMDKIVIQAPVVQQAILNGDAVISGNYTIEQAKSVASQLNGGALPAPLKLIGQSTVGPSLGIESLKKSLFGGIVGLISLVIFMVLLYRKEGILASFALAIYTIIVLFIFKAIPVTLTLAGIAGFILSVGMAVDANILIFERMKEELRAGKPHEIAIKLGFARAWPSIRDSNIASLITTAVLFYFGSGIIRGFAVALAIGIIVSMFSAIIVTRNLLKIFEVKS